jgi:mannose-6-phosphate isomerase-like protein (cupin superfamily)
MQRRLFLQLPLLGASVNLFAEGKQQERVKKGFKVDEDKDRFDEELFFMGGKFYCKVSGKDTNGDLCIYNTIRDEKGGPGLHYHYHQDEWFFVEEGEFLIEIGGERFYLKPGDSAFAPRKIPHAFAKINEGQGRLMVLLQPAGTIELFFKEASKINKKVTQNFIQEFAALSKKHGMKVVGPPLKFE